MIIDFIINIRYN